MQCSERGAARGGLEESVIYVTQSRHQNSPPITAREMNMSKLRIKRIYEAPAKSDGTRLLVDRLWPRGLTREAAEIDYWAQEVAPSSELRQWYAHDPAKWGEFRDRYFAELAQNEAGVAALRAHFGKGVNTLLYQSKEENINNAVALKEYLEGRA
jgi:uncharacterized protein YeaO (DUF488 family)